MILPSSFSDPPGIKRKYPIFNLYMGKGLHPTFREPENTLRKVQFMNFLNVTEDGK